MEHGVRSRVTSINSSVVTAPVSFVWPFLSSQPPPCTPVAYSQRWHQVKHFHTDSKSSLMIWFNPGGKTQYFLKSSLTIISHNEDFDEHRAAENSRPYYLTRHFKVSHPSQTTIQEPGGLAMVAHCIFQKYPTMHPTPHALTVRCLQLSIKKVRSMPPHFEPSEHS